ncbi:MAG: VOC family protein [Gaiellaceae bacterium]
MEQRVTPYLLYEDGAAAIEFLTKAFGFREEMRTTGGAGGMHAELEVAPDGGWIHLGQPPQGFRNPGFVGNTCLVYVVVGDLDGHHARAKGAGARIIEEPADQDYGYRRYGCADPQGHEWYFAQPIAGAEQDG